MARKTAEEAKRYADRKAYGYGEVLYILREDADDFKEQAPELYNEYRRLVDYFYDRITEEL